MKIQTYEDARLQVLRKTENPAELVCQIASQSMHPNLEKHNRPEKLVRYLLTAEHHTPFEFATIVMRLEGISRSLLAQITRHRTFAFVSSSQHYQDYSDYPSVVHAVMAKDDRVGDLTHRAITTSYTYYQRLIDAGVLKEEARQVLPNAAAVNLVLKADARNLINFFRQRRCERNTQEMIMVADLMWAVCRQWFPELFISVGAPCYMNGVCNQGDMKSPKCGAYE